MEKDQDVLERIAALEQEVKDLRIEMHQLQQDKIYKVARPIENVEKPAKPAKSAKVPLFKKYLVLDKEPPVKAEGSKPIKQEPVKLKQSLEETFMWALPKVFMLILVLGVLWGLKLVSDYGFLSDSIKIVLSYVLSIGLGMYAYVMESKNIGSRQVALALYGGAFIVGILTTAAGAIIYDVLGLYTALVIALMYIVYGVAISYVKGNEALTVLVVFTSLLLPYLLEYMNFSGVLIAAFIVLLFVAIQLVIWKHRQQKALYVGAFLSILATFIVSNMTIDHSVTFASSALVLYGVFLISFIRIFNDQAKTKNVHAGLLFGMTLFTMGMINSIVYMSDRSIILLSTILFIGLVAATYQVYQQKKNVLVDVLATVSAIVSLNVIMHFNMTDDLKLMLFVITVFAGLILAFKLQITLMKWVYSLFFTITGYIVFVSNDVKPLFSVQHVTIVLVIGMIVYLFVYLKRLPVEEVVAKDELKWPIRLGDWMPVVIYGAVLVYIYKLDVAYIEMFETNILFMVMVPFILIGVLMLPIEKVGHMLPVAAALVYFIATIMLFGDMWNMSGETMLGIVLRLFYLAVFILVLVDLWMEGRIYKNYELYVKPVLESLFVVGMLIIMLAIFGLTSFANNYGGMDWSAAVITNTVSVFAIASLTLLMATKRDYKNLKLTGIGLLFFGIVKMIFFDLSTLDLLIRSMLFIGIGAVGLVVSNKLLGKK